MSRGRKQAIFGGALAVALTVGATVAIAFTAPMVLYKPPVVKMFDIETNDSVENMVVNQDGDFLLFSSTPAQVAMHPNSDPGCDIDVAVACPKQGIKKVVMNLGAMKDSGEFDLEAGTADKIKQIAKGGADKDDLIGHAGSQTLKGGEGNDALEGGPGKDVLIGGPGEDFCDGGPGKDTLKDCEPPARRTFHPEVLYKPPVIKALDHEAHNSEENMTVTRVGKDFLLNNAGPGFAIAPESDPGCDFADDVLCPRQGVKKIVLLLGNMSDSAEIDLGHSARKVKQILKGGEDNDDLVGGPGPQKLIGGEGNDELIGGPGRDKLDGGPGIDVCIGNNKDTFKNCEPVPMR